MDRQDYTRDWYRSQDFQPPDTIEMRDLRRPRSGQGRMYPPSDIGDHRRPPHAQGRMYPPSDFGDYRKHEEPSPDYNHALHGHHMDKRYIPMPGIALARTRNSFAGIGENQRRAQNGVINRNEGFENRGFDGFDNPRYSGPRGEFPEQRRPTSTGSRLPEDGYVMYDGTKYTPSEPNHYSEPDGVKPRPTWITKAISYREKEEKDEKRGPVLTSGVLARLIVVVCIVWDLCMDWLIVSAGHKSTYFTFDSSEDETKKCSVNEQVFIAFGNDTKTRNATLDLCEPGNVSKIWKALVAFSLIGSLLAIIQIINIGCEMISTCKPGVFQVLHAQSEVLLVLFFEELPQIGMTLSFFGICTCEEGKPIALYGLLSVISATVSLTARYTTSFTGLTEAGGCCNTWWRCGCCKNPDYFCRIRPKELCCTCNVPCPLCCCTLYCRSCKWSPQTWCAPLMKAFSCFCHCCQSDDQMYGIRMVNNLGLLVLWFCSSLQIAIYVITFV